MLWLIWIALMLLVPMVAGVHVWFELHQQPADAPAATTLAISNEAHSHIP